MSDDDHRTGKPGEKPQPGDKDAGDLLGDLESIRSLLEEDRDRERSRSGGRSPSEGEDDEDVPLLEDVVHGGVSVNEAFLAGEADFADSGGEAAAGLNEEIFKALLSDEWRESARGLLDEARSAIEAYQTEWTPRHTDELNEALKVRIDETVQHWLREVVQERIHELRQAILTAVSEQIRATIDEQFTHESTHEDPDGA